ncbi:MAG: hypothetical protein ACI8W8_004726, partial [Rhodothermales bacterium]
SFEQSKGGPDFDILLTFRAGYASDSLVDELGAKQKRL